MGICLSEIIKETSPEIVQMYENMSEQEKGKMESILISIHKKGWSIDYMMEKLIEKKKKGGKR